MKHELDEGRLKFVDLMIGTNIDGVFMDMQAANVARDSARDIEKGEEVLALEMEWIDAIVDQIFLMLRLLNLRYLQRFA